MPGKEVRMRRRDFVMLVGAALASPHAALAQNHDRMRRIGVLMALPPSDPGGQAEAAALEQGLQELGWIKGRNLAIEYRWPGGDLDRARAHRKSLRSPRTCWWAAQRRPSPPSRRRRKASRSFSCRSPSRSDRVLC